MLKCKLNTRYQRWFWVCIVFTLIAQVSIDTYYHQTGGGESAEKYLIRQNKNKCYAKNSLRGSNDFSVQKMVDIYNPLVYAAGGIYLILLANQEK